MRRVKKKLATKSAEIQIHDDILLEIFLRLPLQSIQRCILACKHWQSLITNPTFRKLYIKPPTGLILRSKNPFFIPLSPFTNKPTFPQLKIDHSHRGFLPKLLKINHFCNGLLLCSTGKKYEVYNPTTDRSFTLPKLGKDFVGAKILTMRLAFDPKRFGPHYKVVCYGLRPDPYFQIYSSITRSWQSVSEPSPCRMYDKGVYWNGAIHWLRGSTYFDIENEMFKRMPKMPGYGFWRWNDYFGESCDRLNYVKVLKAKESDLCCVDVRELKRDYSEWVLKYHVELEYQFNDTWVLSIVHGVEDDDSFLVLRTANGIMRYNLVSKITTELPVSLTGGCIDSVFPYIESQCSVC